MTESQFEGCLLGGLVGDCFGYPFENEQSHHYTASKVQHLFDGYLKPDEDSAEAEDDEKHLQYTDDTSMAKCIVQSFLSLSKSETELNPTDLAKRFTENYESETRERSYGSNVHTVFDLLKSTNYADPYGPSHAQFNGQGSYGNGAGMRVAPVALYTVTKDSIEPLVKNAVIASRITHASPLGVVGGIFQALAVRHALRGNNNKNNNNKTPLDILAAFKADFETLGDSPAYADLYKDRLLSLDAVAAYAEKIRVIEQLLKDGNEQLDIKNIKDKLGVQVTALHSIPTAFYCFLAAFKPVSLAPTENQFQRTIQLAISLGGDTDTIAAMAGNIAGAYLGKDAIPAELIKPCEDADGVRQLAQKLFAAGQS